MNPAISHETAVIARASRPAAGHKAHTPTGDRVPMLDWPSNLFGDNATIGELVGVDFLMQCDPSSVPAATHGADVLTTH